MSERVIVNGLQALRETQGAFLFDTSSGQAWVSKRHCSLKNGFYKSYSVARWLADKLGLTYYDLPPTSPYTLEELTQEYTLDNRVLIVPQVANQPHQQDAFNKLYKLNKFVLFMQMRAGKTKTAIELVCNHFLNKTIDSVLWFCPNSAIATANEQWEKYRCADVPVYVNGLETVSGCSRERFERIQAHAVGRYAVVIDESQMVKNHRAKRSRRLLALVEKASVKGLLSGTPITQNIQDLYSQLAMLDWRILGYRSFYQFKVKHLIESDKVPGLIHSVKHVPYISQRVAPFCFEWFKDYTMFKSVSRVAVEMSEQQRQAIARIKTAVLKKLSTHTERAEDIYLLFTAIQSVLAGQISQRVQERLFGTAHKAVQFESPKLAVLVELLEQTPELCLVWCSRRHEVQAIETALQDLDRPVFVVSGAVPHQERHRVIQAFRQSDAGVLVAMVHVAKRAIEMSECNHVFYYGHSFDYEARIQSEARVLLPTKTQAVQYVDLVYHRSLDERILGAAQRKENILKSFLALLKTDRQQAIREVNAL